jgi:hypothetical protein
LVHKRDASPHVPNGVDHTVGFMVFPGAVFSWEGKQHGLVRTDGHFRGWQSFPSGAPCGGGWNPGISPRARYKGALFCRPSLGGSCDNAPLILLPRSWPQGPGAPGSSGQDTSPTVKPTTRLAQTRRPTSSCTRRGGPFGRGHLLLRRGPPSSLAIWSQGQQDPPGR